MKLNICHRVWRVLCEWWVRKNIEQLCGYLTDKEEHVVGSSHFDHSMMFIIIMTFTLTFNQNISNYLTFLCIKIFPRWCDYWLTNEMNSEWRMPMHISCCCCDTVHFNTCVKFDVPSVLHTFKITNDNWNNTAAVRLAAAAAGLFNGHLHQ